MKRYALLLLLVLGISTTAWGHHIGIYYCNSNLTMFHWSGGGLCPNPCPTPDPCPTPNPCPNPCPSPCWPQWWCGPFGWGVTSSSSESSAITTGPGATAVAETSGQSFGPGSYSSSSSYSLSISQ